MAAPPSLAGSSLVLGSLLLIATAGLVGFKGDFSNFGEKGLLPLGILKLKTDFLHHYHYSKFWPNFSPKHLRIGFRTLRVNENHLSLRRFFLDKTKRKWKNYNNGSWLIDEGAITINGTKVQCETGHGYLYRPDYIENERKQANNLSIVWQRPWNPSKGKFMIGWCKVGRISNHVRCFRQVMLLAGLLNRTLIQPLVVDMLGIDLSPYFDLDHMRQCYGNNTVISYNDYVKTYGSPPVLDHVLCIEGGSCPINANQTVGIIAKRGWYKGSTVSPNVTVWGFPRKPHRKSADYMVEHYGKIPEGVLHVHSEHLFNIIDSPYFKDGYPVDAPFQKRGECYSNLALQPPVALIRAAEEYIDFDVGHRNFLGIHLRLGDFKGYCSGANSQCGYTLDEMVSCIHRQLERSNLSFVFIASNGRHEELQKIEFRDHVIKGHNVTFFDFRGGKELKGERWAKGLKEKGFDISKVSVQVAFEKTICSMALLFLGSASSTFSTDIMRLRYGFRTATCADDFYCGPAKGPKSNGDNL